MEGGIMFGLAKKVLFSVDVEVTYNIEGRPRSLVVPQNIEASSEEEAARSAVEKERHNVRTIPKSGEPIAKSVRKLEFREGW